MDSSDTIKEKAPGYRGPFFMPFFMGALMEFILISDIGVSYTIEKFIHF